MKSRKVREKEEKWKENDLNVKRKIKKKEIETNTDNMKRKEEEKERKGNLTFKRKIKK